MALDNSKKQSANRHCFSLPKNLVWVKLARLTHWLKMSPYNLRRNTKFLLRTGLVATHQIINDLF